MRHGVGILLVLCCVLVVARAFAREPNWETWETHGAWTLTADREDIRVESYAPHCYQYRAVINDTSGTAWTAELQRAPIGEACKAYAVLCDQSPSCGSFDLPERIPDHVELTLSTSPRHPSRPG